MSGGSYDYLFRKDSYDYVTIHSSLTEMVERLERDYPGTKAAKDSRAFLDTVTGAEQRIDEMLTKDLRDVWQTVEWVDSYDMSEPDLAKRVERYEKGPMTAEEAFIEADLILTRLIGEMHTQMQSGTSEAPGAARAFQELKRARHQIADRSRRL